MDSKTNITKIINSLKFIIFLSKPKVVRPKWTDYKGASPYYMVLISTITNCHCSTTLACSLHRGKGVHFLRLRFLNRSMWKNFFPAVISKKPRLGSRSRIFMFYGTNLYGQTGVGFPRWLCQHIIFWTLCQICHRA